MELPHLELSLRRLLARPVRRSWREALTSRPGRALLTFIAWVLLTVVQLLLLDHSYMTASPAWRWFRENGSDYFAALVTAIGVGLVLYFSASRAAQCCCAQRHDSLDWYSTRLKSSQALVGAVGAGVLEVLPLLSGLAVYCAALSWANAGIEPHPLHGLTLLDTLMLALRLPGFLLLTVALTLALDQRQFAAHVPGVLALGGAALTCWRSWPGVLDYRGSLPFTDWVFSLPLGALAAAGGLIALVTLLLVVRSVQWQPLLASALICCVALLPVAIFGLVLAAPSQHASFPRYSTPLSSMADYAIDHEAAAARSLPLFYFAAALFPSVNPQPTSKWYFGRPVAWREYVVAVGRERCLLVLLSLLASLLWWNCAVRGLDLARGAQPRRSRERSLARLGRAPSTAV